MSTHGREFLDGNRHNNFQKLSNNDIDRFFRTLSLTQGTKRAVESTEFLLMDAFELLP